MSLLPNQTTGSQVIAAIVMGETDDVLDKIIEAAQQRQDAVGSSLGRTLRVGDIVKFNDKGRPRYLNGLHAKVLKVNAKSIKCQIVDEHREAAKRFGYGPFNSPISLIEGKVEEGIAA